MSKFSIIGESPVRVDALAKVTGQAKYTADYNIPGMLHLKMVKSPYPHARIKKIDTSKADCLFGVRGIVIPSDAPNKRTGTLLQDRFLLPRDNIVRYVGEPIALIAADSIDIAEEAAELIKIDYEELPGIFDVEQAINKNSPLIHPERENYIYQPHPRYGDIKDQEISNLQNSAFILSGDVTNAFQQSDIIVENKFIGEALQQAPIETHIAAAWIEADGTLVVRSSQQGYHALKNHLSQLFDLPVSKVKVLGPYLGGGFGSKLTKIPASIVAMAALKLRKPVQLEYTRDEDLQSGGHNSKIVIEIKNGVKKDGTILALEGRVLIDGGAYGADLMGVIPRTALNGFGAVYRIPNVKVHAYAIYTNRSPGCTMRGVEAPHVSWAVEQQMDIIAEKLGIDSFQLRAKNILLEGDENPVGEIAESIGVKECMEKVSDWIQIKVKSKSKNDKWVAGKGIGIGPCLVGLGYSASSKIVINSDGTIKLFFGSSEMGQGSHTAFAQIAAEEFKMPISKVNVIYGDTDITPWDWDNQASRTTVSTGHAVIRACQDAKRQIFELAAPKMGLATADLDLADGRIYCIDFPSISMSIKDLFSPVGLVKGVGEIIGRGEFTSTAPPMDPKTGRFKRLALWAFAAYGAEIAVNIETGEIKILRLSCALDLGQPINTKLCEQQIEGGMGMAVGISLFEQLVFDKGRLMNPDFVNYKLPTFMDIPSNSDFKSIIVCSPHKDGPYGAKGFGEAPLVAASGAIANAVYAAIGKRLYSLPLTREKVLSAIQQR